MDWASTDSHEQQGETNGLVLVTRSDGLGLTMSTNNSYHNGRVLALCFAYWVRLWLALLFKMSIELIKQSQAFFSVAFCR